MEIKYRKHPAGFVVCDGYAHLPKFFRSIAPDTETLLANLRKEFPGEPLELVLISDVEDSANESRDEASLNGGTIPSWFLPRCK